MPRTDLDHSGEIDDECAWLDFLMAQVVLGGPKKKQ